MEIVPPKVAASDCFPCLFDDDRDCLLDQDRSPDTRLRNTKEETNVSPW